MIPKKVFRRVLLFLHFFLASGCVTERAVHRAIAESNVAVIAPYGLDDPSAGIEDNNWEQTVKKLDTLIQQYEGTGQEVLVAQLKVRQAMILTINKQDALATHRWSTIKRGDLRTERDKALLEASTTLVWAYGILPSDDRITLSAADDYVRKLDGAISGTSSRNLLAYLHLIRAQIQLRVVNGLDEKDEGERASAKKILKESLAKFVRAFTPEQQNWVQASERSSGAMEKGLSDFRERIWLRNIIRAYRLEGIKYGVEWEPAWVAGVPLK